MLHWTETRSFPGLQRPILTRAKGACMCPPGVLENRCPADVCVCVCPYMANT